MANTIENGLEFEIPLVESIDPVEEPVRWFDAAKADAAANSFFRYTSTQFKRLHENNWACYNAREDLTKHWYFDEHAQFEMQIHELWRKEDPDAVIKPILEQLVRDLPRFSQMPVIEELDDSDLEERQSSYFATSKSSGQDSYKSSTEQIVALKR